MSKSRNSRYYADEIDDSGEPLDRKALKVSERRKKKRDKASERFNDLERVVD
jgi:hypothetical protein